MARFQELQGHQAMTPKDMPAGWLPGTVRACTRAPTAALKTNSAVTELEKREKINNKHYLRRGSQKGRGPRVMSPNAPRPPGEAPTVRREHRRRRRRRKRNHDFPKNRAVNLRKLHRVIVWLTAGMTMPR